MPISFDKPFKTYPEMIKLMRSRNIIVNDDAFAESALQNFSYYTLVNGYKESFLALTGSDQFVPGTTFEQLYTLATIDKSLSNVVLKYILYIEGALKSRISYVVSRNYGVDTEYSVYNSRKIDDYLSPVHYIRSPKRNNTLKKFKQVINDPKSVGAHQTNSLKHYVANHNHVPAWILATSLTLGDVILWYSILTPADKEEICNSFIDGKALSVDEKKEYVRKSLDLIREFRNNIAHSGRIFNCIGTIQLPKKQALILAPDIIDSAEYNASVSAKSGTHAVVVALATLIHDLYMLSAFYADIKYVFELYNKVSIQGKTIQELFGLPADIVDRFEDMIS